jgi:hypothetical protein
MLRYMRTLVFLLSLAGEVAVKPSEGGLSGELITTKTNRKVIDIDHFSGWLLYFTIFP